jgi:hypothetical protein
LPAQLLFLQHAGQLAGHHVVLMCAVVLQLVRVVAPGVSGVLHMAKKFINFDTFVAGFS